jgi:uncharacterized membrane protein
MILELSEGSSALTRGAAALILSLHITAGTGGIFFGAAALLARKGSQLHRRAGTWFFGSMLTMSVIGTFVSPFLSPPNWSNVIGGAFTFYLVVTSWMTIRRKEGSIGRFETGALVGALGIAILCVTLGLLAMNSPTGTLDGTPLPAYFIFSIGAALAASGDLRMILRRGITGAQRIARHLWRTCVALFIAAGSFFLGQQQVFPASMRGSPWFFVPEIAILGLLIYWLIRVRFTNWIRRGAGDRHALGGRSRDPDRAAESA